MTPAFYLSPSHSSSSSLSSSDSAALPFPKPLSRASFLTPSFSPTEFLSTLTSRFQTLEDLRSELAQLSQNIQNELVDLVNDNYSDFLSLGSSLSGGEEKVEEIRVGMLGFERDVAGLREKVALERERVALAMEEKRELMRQITVGRGLLEIDERLEELEIELGLRKRVVTAVQDKTGDHDGVEEVKEEWGQEWDDSGLVESEDEDDEDDEDEGKSSVPTKLRKRVEQFLVVMVLVVRFGLQHPFLVAEQVRIRKLRDTLLLDMDVAIREQQDVKGKQEILRLRSSVEE